MIELQKKMDALYYQYIDAHANNNKIKINLPDKDTGTKTDTNTDSELKYSDEYIYRKPWNKLNSVHKIIKIKEFINNLEPDDVDMKNKLKLKLIDMIKEKKLSKKNDIIYDSNIGNIISIPILQYSNYKYIIV
jgi:hypothetical protein